MAAATAGDNLELAQEAERPSEPSSPRPLRNAVIAFFGSFLLALLVALARDRLRDRRPAGPAREGARAARRRRARGTGVAASTPETARQTPEDGRRPEDGPDADGARTTGTSMHRP